MSSNMTKTHMMIGAGVALAASATLLYSYLKNKNQEKEDEEAAEILEKIYEDHKDDP